MAILSQEYELSNVHYFGLDLLDLIQNFIFHWRIFDVLREYEMQRADGTSFEVCVDLVVVCHFSDRSDRLSVVSVSARTTTRVPDLRLPVTTNLAIQFEDC